MTDPAHEHGHRQRQPAHAGHGRTDRWSGLHRKWPAWLALGLMLLAMAIYVLSMDESIEPEGTAQPASPSER